MAMIVSTYEEVRPEIRLGDTIGFGGYGPLERIVKRATGSHISHVSMVLQAKAIGDLQNRHINLIIEAMLSGVSTNRLSDRILDFKGEVWWLPLNRVRYGELDQDKLIDFLLRIARERVPYDIKQAIKSALDRFDENFGRTYNEEDLSALFCSELNAAGLERGKFVKRSVNCSEVTPIDYARWKVHDPDYYLLKGDLSKKLTGHNTLNPEIWEAVWSSLKHERS